MANGGGRCGYRERLVAGRLKFKSPLVDERLQDFAREQRVAVCFPRDPHHELRGRPLIDVFEDPPQFRLAQPFEFDAQCVLQPLQRVQTGHSALAALSFPIADGDHHALVLDEA